MDYAFANHLVVSEDRALTRELTAEIVHAQNKLQHVLEIAEKKGILLDQIICVGDGANGVLIMDVAGLGVAFAKSPARLNSKSILASLYLFGISKKEQETSQGFW